MRDITRILSLLIALFILTSWAYATEESLKKPQDSVADIRADKYVRDTDQLVPVDVMPEMIYEEPPEYPRKARKAGAEGIVYIEVLVDQKGNVRKALVYRPSGTKVGFEEAALKAAYKCRYKPAMQNGTPVAIWVVYEVDFSLARAGFPDPDELIPADKPAEMIYEEPPEYPRLAIQARLEGVVWVKSLVGKDGNVVKATIHKSSGSKAGFDDAAVAAAYKCRFKPAIKGGSPSAAWVIYPVAFTLTGKYMPLPEGIKTSPLIMRKDS
jgi:TonB family protein